MDIRRLSLILTGSIAVLAATSISAQDRTNGTGASVVAQAGAPNVQIEKAPRSDTKPATPTPSATPTPTPDPVRQATQELYDSIQRRFLRVAKDESGSRLIWTDTILLEVGNSLPPDPLASVIKDAPVNNGTLATWIRDTFEKQLSAWHPGRKELHPSHEGTAEITNESDGSHCFVNPVYVSYLEARYPNAKILVRTPLDPVIFTDKGQICAVVAPWTTLPDGTPLQ